jgi:putative endonuclease
MLPFFKRFSFFKKPVSVFLKSPRQKQGHAAEITVQQWLEQHKYTIVATNFRTKYGEIDIIACKGTVLCFVEVKARTTDFLSVAELVPPAKQRKIAATAHYFLAQHPSHNYTYRFDIAYVQGSADTSYIRYIPNAFVPAE